MMPIDQQNQPTIYSYSRGEGRRAVVLVSTDRRMGQQQVVLDSSVTKFQTVVLELGADYEIVLELRPRQLTQKEQLEIGISKI